MYNVSTEFMTKVLGSHTVKSKAVILNSAGIPLDTPLYITAGKVSVDGTASVRRTCDLSLVDPTGVLTPQSGAGTGPLAPYGVEIQLSRGVVLSSGLTEYAPLGVFRVSTNDIQENDSASRTIAIKGYDRARAISRNKFTVEYIIAAGTNYETAITTLISDSWTGLSVPVISSVPTPAVTPLLVFEIGGDPWEQAQAMAKSIGYELYFDGLGVAILQPLVVPTSALSIVSYVEGPNSVLMDLSASLDDAEGYNGVIITGESTSIPVPVRGEAWDMDPTSPTYYLGAYGQVPVFETNAYVVTQDAATAAAQARLQFFLGKSQQVGFSIVPNPAHEPGDALTVKRLVSGINSDYILQAFDVPLMAKDSMSMILTNKQVVQ